MQQSPLNSAGLLDTYVKAKTTKFFGLATEITKMNEFFKNCQYKSSLHRFYALLFLVVKAKAMEANSGSDEARKR
jgi:hypothetical protein